MIPKLVHALVTNHQAWIVGSAANPSVTSPRDFDVVVPFSEWGKACHLVPRNAKANSFGGWKVVSDGIEVDMWPGDVGYLMLNPRTTHVWQPFHGIRFTREVDLTGKLNS